MNSASSDNHIARSSNGWERRDDVGRNPAVPPTRPPARPHLPLELIASTSHTRPPTNTPTTAVYSEVPPSSSTSHMPDRPSTLFDGAVAREDNQPAHRSVEPFGSGEVLDSQPQHVSERRHNLPA